MKPAFSRPAWMFLLGAMLGGCRSGGADAAPPFRVSLEVPDTVPSGEPVRVVFRIANASPRAARFQFGGLPETPSFELVVARSFRREVWRRSRHEDFLASAVAGKMPPGETMESHYQWDQTNNRGDPLAPGTYWLRAYIEINRREVHAPPARLVISPK